MERTDKQRIYLDYNATTPPAPPALRAFRQALTLWANPASAHQSGGAAKALLWQSRLSLARAINCHPLEIVFTGGASEANNQALKGFSPSKTGGRNEIIVSAVEHPSVKAVARWLSCHGMRVHIVPISRDGRLDESFFKKVLSEKTHLVSIMRAHNETGLLFPIKKLARAARRCGALFHSDLVQALGKEPVDMKSLGVDTASFSAHKVYGLKGCGALYCRKGLDLESLIHGGGQERGRRAGTENLPAIAAFGAVAEGAVALVQKTRELKQLRDRLEEAVLSALSGVRVVGFRSSRLPNTSCFLFSGVEGEVLLMNLDLKGFSVSAGSACHSGKITASPALLAMGFSPEEAGASLRVSLGCGVKKRDIDLFSRVLTETVTRLRSL